METETIQAASEPWVQNPAALLAILLTILAIIFWLTDHPVMGRVFKVIPALVFCYFVPTTLTTLNIIPDQSALYDWIKTFVLPASLLLLILALDLPAIIRLGPKAVIMLLTGTAGVVIGAPIALLLTRSLLPDDAWQGMSALAGSWIGGGANFVAMGRIAGTSDNMLALMVIPDVVLANIWMGTLLYLSGHQQAIDRWTGANATAIYDLQKKMADFQARTSRIPSLTDLLIILALGFGGSWLSYWAGGQIPEIETETGGTLISHSTWKYVLVTTAGVLLSFTAARGMEGAGASRIGSLMIYLLVACIGASADFKLVFQAPSVILMGAIWIAMHISLLLFVGWLIKAPLFFVAVGSQANIGGAASAPVVASAFHPALAPVGALLAVAGYVLGTYAGWVCMQMLKSVANL